jgi:lipopolysaccharide transport protein LptA
MSRLVTSIFLLAVVLAPSVGLVAEPDNTIRIRADALETDIEGNTAEFSGNVRVDRGEARMEADHLKLYYRRDRRLEDLQQLNAAGVDKIEARGNVRIRYQGISALTDRAVYDPPSDTLTMEGGNTRVARNGNSISGARIVLRGAENDMTVVGDGRRRVRAVIGTGSGWF